MYGHALNRNFWRRCWHGEEPFGHSLDLFVANWLLNFGLGWTSNVLLAFLPQGAAIQYKMILLLPVFLLSLALSCFTFVCWWRCAKNVSIPFLTWIFRLELVILALLFVILPAILLCIIAF